MRNISLAVLLAAAVFVSGCKTKAYVREMNREQGQSVQNNNNTNPGAANQGVAQATK